MIEQLFSSQVLFSVLETLFIEGARSLPTSEIIKRAQKNQANVLRELEKLVSYGFVLKEKKGNQNFYILNTENQYYNTLTQLFQTYESTHHAEYQKMWSRRPYPPSVMYVVARATVDGFGAIFPSHIKSAGNYWTQEENTYFYHKHEIESTVSDLLAVALREPQRIISLFHASFEKGKEFVNFSEKFLKKDIAKIATKTLADFYLQAMEKFYEMYSYGTVPILIGYSDDNVLYQKAHAMVAAKTRRSPEQFSKYFIALIAVPKKLEIDNQNVDILRIAKKAQRLGLTSLGQVESKLRHELVGLVSKYGFMSYDLKNGISWDVQHYAQLVHEKLETDIDAAIESIDHYEEKTEREFRRAIKHLGLPQRDLIIFGVLRMLGYYKWAREYLFIHALYNIKPIQDELAKRLGMSGVDFRFLLPDEVRDAVYHAKKYTTEIARRRKYCMLWVRPNTTVQCYSGDEAEQRINSIVFPTKNKAGENVDVLKGTPASSGKVRGKVTIVNIIRHVDKMTEGNVLVSIATTPDLLPAMKKASAIVTDEGGVTCHAAIVSRELKIPCVVGTKQATKVLSDGDEVEVDAGSGIVTVIKRV